MMLNHPIAFPPVAAVALIGLITGILFESGCTRNSDPIPSIDLGMDDDSPSLYPSFADEVVFTDEVSSNFDETDELMELTFVSGDGEDFRLDQFQGRKNVLLVFMRGFSGEICPFCTTQTSRLIRNYSEIAKRNVEVLLVYPGPRERFADFQKASTMELANSNFPFPVLFDEDLAAVEKLGIGADLAHPSTFILNKRGSIQLAYVGSNPSDRPSIKAIMSKLDSLSE